MTKEEQRAYEQLWELQFPELVRPPKPLSLTAQPAHYRRQFKYGISPDQFNLMMEAQNNTCAICSQPFTSTPNVDHCHSTMVVRGLLCRSCNLGLGYFKDSTTNLQVAIDYLHKYKQ